MKRFQSKRSKIWWTLLKLGGCGALIAAIATTIAILGTSSESHADIAWLSPFERSNQESFQSALENLGHEQPRRYNLNGNTVFFSTNTSRKSPRQLMVEYQEEFQRQGINDRVYVDVGPQARQERTETALTGGLIPLVVTDRYVALAGVVTANDADDPSTLLENYGDADKMSELFRAHRFIELTRAPDSRHTSIVASWSDEEFDYARMVPGSDAEGQIYDTVVPVCPGCTRLSRFADENRGGRQVEMSFIGPRTIDETRHYYAHTLTNQGWQREDLSQPFAEIEKVFETDLPHGKSDLYRLGDKHLKLSFLTDDRTGHTITIATYE